MGSIEMLALGRIRFTTWLLSGRPRIDRDTVRAGEKAACGSARAGAIVASTPEEEHVLAVSPPASLLVLPFVVLPVARASLYINESLSSVSAPTCSSADWSRSLRSVTALLCLLNLSSFSTKVPISCSHILAIWVCTSSPLCFTAVRDRPKNSCSCSSHVCCGSGSANNTSSSMARKGMAELRPVAAMADVTCARVALTTWAGSIPLKTRVSFSRCRILLLREDISFWDLARSCLSSSTDSS
mmetsp:Transcript_24556/g.40410  ORF Transcript_24556/g.40410 Transcript_24556/m.40410 type:complete len:242 (+) Transcript_24556:511-1236(+)